MKYGWLQLQHRYLLVRDDHGLRFVGSPDAGLTEAHAYVDGELREDGSAIAPFAAALATYLRGETRRFEVPLAMHGTAFQRRVWLGLQALHYGETVSYSALAQRIGAPTAVRAVATAVGKNPLMVFVPCHRVVRKDGSVGQYRGGQAMKRALLALEAGQLAQF